MSEVPERIGPYQVVRELARGGQGVVYEAVHGEWNVRAAVKVLLDRDPVLERRFRREAEALGRCAHPNLLKVKDLGDVGGVPYMVTELIDGDDLDRLIGRQGICAWERTVEVLAATARALHHAHERGILHRDVKPQNVLIERGSGRPVLVDFGMVRRDPASLGKFSQASVTRLTQDGEILGTPSYMAPEQVDPKFGGIGPRTDVYALGATLYHSLTGNPPFNAPTVLNVFLQVMEQEALDPRELNAQVPKDLADLCLRAMSKSPEERPADAEEFARLLEEATLVVSAPRRQMLVRGLGLLLCAVLVAGSLWVALGLDRLGSAREAFAEGRWAEAEQRALRVAGAARAGESRESGLLAVEARLWAAGFDRQAARRDAIGAIDRLLPAGPWTARAYGLRAYARLGAGETWLRFFSVEDEKEALSDAGRALKHEPNEPLARLVEFVASLEERSANSNRGDWAMQAGAAEEGALVRCLPALSGPRRGEALGCLAAFGGEELAEARLRGALEAYPATEPFALERAALLCAVGRRFTADPERARALFQQALSEVPRFATAQFRLWELELQAAGGQKAVLGRGEPLPLERLRASLDGVRPFAKFAHRYVTLCLVGPSPTTESLEDCLRVLDESQRMVRLAPALRGEGYRELLRGRVLKRLRRKAEARRAYERARSLPDEPLPGGRRWVHAQCSSELAALDEVQQDTVSLGLAEEAFLLGDWPRARNRARRAAKHGPPEQRNAAALLAAEAQLWAGGFVRGRYREQVLAEIDAVIARAPSAHAWGLRAYALLDAGERLYRFAREARRPALEEALGTALALDASQPHALVAAAVLARAQDGRREALGRLERDLRRAASSLAGPRRAEALAVLGTLRVQELDGDLLREAAAALPPGPERFAFDRALLLTLAGSAGRVAGLAMLEAAGQATGAAARQQREAAERLLDQARGDLNRALKHLTGYASARHELGQLLLLRGGGFAALDPERQKKALRHLERSARGKRATVGHLLAYAELRLRRDSKATQEELEECLQLLSEDRRWIKPQGEERGEGSILLLRGKALRKLGRKEEAKTAFERVLVLDEEPTRPLATSHEIASRHLATLGVVAPAPPAEWLRIGEEAFLEGRWKAARVHAQGAMENGDPSTRESAGLLAAEALLWGAGFERAPVRAQALAEIEEVLAGSPDSARALGLRAYAYLEAGEECFRYLSREHRDEVVPLAEQALAVDPSQPHALVVCAVLVRRRKGDGPAPSLSATEVDERLRARVNAFARGPRKGEALGCLAFAHGWARVSSKDLEQSLEAYPRSAPFRLERALTNTALAWLAKRDKRFAAARRHLDAAEREAPDYSPPQTERARLELRQGGGLRRASDEVKRRSQGMFRLGLNGERALYLQHLEYVELWMSKQTPAPSTSELLDCLALLDSGKRRWVRLSCHAPAEGRRLYLRGWALTQLGQHEQAKEALDQVLALPDETFSGGAGSIHAEARFLLAKRRPR